MFICTIIRLDSYKWDYGRKWRVGRMMESKIKLPTTNDGNPDWNYMEDYIRNLPFSDLI